jgi:hypothetical protein
LAERFASRRRWWRVEQAPQAEPIEMLRQGYKRNNPRYYFTQSTW